MKKLLLLSTVTLIGICRISAQDIHLHVNPQWQECSFQIDSSLTQNEFHQFAQEGGLILYFRPLIDAKPMGKGQVELSILEWKSKIDEHDGAWNNMFVHPDSTHWLVGGPVLPFPGLTFRAGLTSKLDAGVYWTMRPGANYGVCGLQLQYNLLNNETTGWSASGRVSSMYLYGPRDVRVNTFGTDFVASRRFSLLHNHLFFSPYAGGSLYLSHAQEKAAVVNLHNENRFGAQANVGAVAQVSIVRLAVEYNLAAVRSLSFKIGVAYAFGKKKE